MCWYSFKSSEVGIASSITTPFGIVSWGGASSEDDWDCSPKSIFLNNSLKVKLTHKVLKFVVRSARPHHWVGTRGLLLGRPGFALVKCAEHPLLFVLLAVDVVNIVVDLGFRLG
jgi:hypothetical protein